jgi:hypothetical protein
MLPPSAASSLLTLSTPTGQILSSFPTLLLYKTLDPIARNRPRSRSSAGGRWWSMSRGSGVELQVERGVSICPGRRRYWRWVGEEDFLRRCPICEAKVKAEHPSWWRPSGTTKTQRRSPAPSCCCRCALADQEGCACHGWPGSRHGLPPPRWGASPSRGSRQILEGLEQLHVYEPASSTTTIAGLQQRLHQRQLGQVSNSSIEPRAQSISWLKIPKVYLRSAKLPRARCCVPRELLV